MPHNEHHIYTAPTNLEAMSSTEKRALRIITKENLGAIGVSNVVDISNRHASRVEATQLEHPSSSYSANVDSGVSQDTIYPHLGSLDLPPQSE